MHRVSGVARTQTPDARRQRRWQTLNAEASKYIQFSREPMLLL